MKRKKMIAISLFFLGLAILSYPYISRLYYDIQFRQEVAIMTEKLMNEPSSDVIYAKQKDYNHSKVTDITEIEVANVSFLEDSDTSKQQTGKIDLTDGEIIGILRIPSINLEYPIYDGATDANLLKGVARIAGTSYPVGGINTNSVIAGHSGLVNRTYFSHIKKLKKGDIVEIQNKKETLRYEVYKTAVIEPNDTAALAVIPGQDTITLLTCTWPPPGTHRYLVFAKRI